MAEVIFYILAFAAAILVTFAATYLILTLYIKHKRRVIPKYHFTSPMEEKKLTRDYDLKPTVQTGVDGSSAMNDFRKG